MHHHRTTPPHRKNHHFTFKEGEESAPTSSVSSTVSTVRVENVELADAADDDGRGSASSGFRPINAEIFTVERPKPTFSKSRVRCSSQQDKPLFLGLVD